MDIDRKRFYRSELVTLTGGLHSLELESLRPFELESAHSFFKGYGFDLSDPEEEERVWEYHSRAIAYLKSELLTEDEDIPDELSRRSELVDLARLMIYATHKDELGTWACAILKVIHVLIHLDNDLFTLFSKDIQDQVLKPIQKLIYNGPIAGPILTGASGEKVVLKKFAVKPFKRPESSLTKLLAKPEVVAFSILDKLGVRFVTKNLCDVFALLKILVDNNLVSIPHTVPKESNNSLFPTQLFLDLVQKYDGQQMSENEFDEIMRKTLQEEGNLDLLNVKKNIFTDKSYRFVKFISRKLIKVNIGYGGKQKKWSFFYPFEVQVMDYETYLRNMEGDASHAEYKNRQKDEARRRIVKKDPVFYQGHKG